MHTHYLNVMSNIQYLLVAALLLVSTACKSSNEKVMEQKNNSSSSVFPQHEPMGTGVGVKPGRVAWSWNRDAVKWDGTGHWYNLDNYDEAAVQQLVSGGIACLAGCDNAADGWKALFAYNKTMRGLQGGYQKGEKIAIKANMNGAAEYDNDTTGMSTDDIYTNPVVLKCLLTSLVSEGGVSPENITVFDVTRLFPTFMKELCSQGILSGVHFVGRDNGVADTSAPVVWTQHKSSTTSYFPTCLTQATYLINLATLKEHDYGVTLCAKNHFGSFINNYRMRAPQQEGLHSNVARHEMDTYQVLTDLMANYQIYPKTVLYILEALVCPSGNTVSVTKENSWWQQPPFNGDFTNSMLFSQDAVAIDGVGCDFLMNEPTVTSRNSALRNTPSVQSYLHEAAQVADAPSGAVYMDGNGQRVTNLGVHEHWNNINEKKYSRNLGKSEGVELVLIDQNSESTGISNASAAKYGSDSSYTVNGIAVNESDVHGVYIRDGKKHIKR